MLRIVEDKYIVSPEWGGGDGIIVRGSDGFTLVRNCVVDFTERPLDSVDEAISFVEGADAHVVHCRFTGTGKLVLCGSGDTPELDVGASVVFEECIFSDFCRRAPEAQDKVSIILRRCLVKNWGDSNHFTVRCFGAWAHHGARIVAQDCIFWQSHAWPGLVPFFTDLANWIGWSFNQRSLRLLDYLLPGKCRALTASQGGEVFATGCYKNHWWLRIEGHAGPYMEKNAALSLMERLESVCPSVVKN